MALRPSEERLRELAAMAPGARVTGFGSVNVRTRVTARARSSTYWVGAAPHRLPGATLPGGEGRRLARLQDRHLSAAGQVVVDGYLGASGPLRLPVRLVVEATAASLAGMQRHLFFDPVQGEASFEPALTVVATPEAQVPSAPDGAAVAVWLERGVTRVLGTDFFGETKKAFTRMWSERVYDAGGLVLPTPRGPATVVVAGPPDSGKSTLVLGSPADAVVQDDFVALMPGGQVVPAENGCIEKTAGLDPAHRPVLHEAATRPDTYLENAPQRGAVVRFDDVRRARHSRAVFPLHALGAVAHRPLPPLALLVLLEPRDPLAPALARVPVDAAPGCYLLRERDQGLAEPTGRLGNRLRSLLAACDAEVVVVNTATAWPDGPGDVRGTAARTVLAALLAGHVEWQPDPQLGVDVGIRVPGVVDPGALWPRARYASRGRLADYDACIAARGAERRAYLSGFAGLDPDIVAALR